MVWQIDKQFSFCYGHRVWSQELKEDFCSVGDTQCKCRHLHGHEGLAHVFLESDQLERGMVTDFKHLGFLKDFLDTYIDHRFIVDRNDPMYDMLVNETYRILSRTYTFPVLEEVFVPGTNHKAGRVVKMDGLPNHRPEYEVLEGYFIVDFVPTSENLSKWLFDCASSKMSTIGIKVKRIDWFETPKSRSSYIG